MGKGISPWIKFAETYYPSLLSNISSCRSPQQMFGSVVREAMPSVSGKPNKDIVSVSIMPCTAKKFEARRPEFEHDGQRDVDYVLTTQELGELLSSSGIDLAHVPPMELDKPLGVSTGGGIIFGVTGGVMEAVLRFAEEVVGGEKNAVEFKEVRGDAGIREAEVMLNGEPLHLAVVHGLSNARKIAEQVVNGTCKYDLIEVMACPMGCVGGAGQPVSVGAVKKKMRAQGLFASDRNNQMRKAQENPAVKECYEKYLGGAPASHKAHEVLHTHYVSRPKILDMETDLIRGGLNPVDVELNFAGQNMKNGAEKLMGEVLAKVRENKWTDKVKVKVTFGKAGENPIVSVAGKAVKPDVQSVVGAVESLLK